METLILAFVYGMILENINVSLSQAYFYSKDFLFTVFNSPIAIGAGWAIVYYFTRKLAEKYKFKWYQSPFFMALIAVIFDMILDPIAVRSGFWNWCIPLSQEWFGVPYDNLVGWMAVVWTFALLVNFSERNFFNKNISKMIKYAAAAISPVLLSLQIAVYVSFSAIFSGRLTLGEILKFYKNGDFSYVYLFEVQVWKFYFFALIFLALAVYSVKNIIFQKRRIH